MKALTPQQTRGVQHDASHPESRPAPVIANSSSLLGQAQAVQNRITEQREAPGGSVDSTPDPKEGVSDALAEPSALKDSSAAEAPLRDGSKGTVVQQVDIENQQPWKQSDSKKLADTNIDLSLTGDSTSDDAEERADAAEKAASQLSAAAETSPADVAQHTEQQASVADEPKNEGAPAAAPLKDAASPSLSESASPVKDTAGTDRSDTEQSSDRAQRVPPASRPEAVEIEPGKFVMTTPLADAAAPADAPATASAPQDKEAAGSRDESASEPVPVETHDGQTVMTTPLEDAAALNEPLDTGPKTEGGVADTDPKPVTSPRVVIDTQKSTVVTRPQEGAAASSDAPEDAAQSLQEALQEAVDSSSGESQEAPAFAALDASMLDEPGTDDLPEFNNRVHSVSQPNNVKIGETT